MPRNRRSSANSTKTRKPSKLARYIQRTGHVPPPGHKLRPAYEKTAAFRRRQEAARRGAATRKRREAAEARKRALRAYKRGLRAFIRKNLPQAGTASTVEVRARRSRWLAKRREAYGVVGRAEWDRIVVEEWRKQPDDERAQWLRRHYP